MHFAPAAASPAAARATAANTSPAATAVNGRPEGTATNGKSGGAAIAAPPPPPPPPPVWKAPEHFFDRDAPSSVYLGERRHYEKLHSLEEFDPLKNFRFFGQLALHAVLLWIVFVVGQIGITIFTLILSVISPEVGLIIGSLIEFAWFIAIACVFWLVKVPSQVSEWKFTVDDKGAVAPTTLDHIAWSLGQRNPPLDIMKVRRFALPGGEHRDLLELRQGIYYGLVSTLANGEDLYVGWTFWVYMSPVRLLWTFILRIVAQVRGHGNALYAMCSSTGPRPSGSHCTARCSRASRWRPAGRRRTDRAPSAAMWPSSRSTRPSPRHGWSLSHRCSTRTDRVPSTESALWPRQPLNRSRSRHRRVADRVRRRRPGPETPPGTLRCPCSPSGHARRAESVHWAIPSDQS